MCISTGPTAEWLDFFMESTSSVRVNGLLYSLELVEEKLLFFFFEGRFHFIEFCVELAGGVFSTEICNGLFTCYFVVCYG